MVKKVYYLASCDTCKRILKDLELAKKEFELREIKSQPVTEGELEDMKLLSGSYEALFSKMARKYKELHLSQKMLSEEDIKHYILSDYTFLKRPVIIFGDKIFAGNSSAVVNQAKTLIA